MAIPVGTLGTTRTVSTITYAGASATQVAASVVDSSSFSLHTEIWTLANPATGANNLVFTPTASVKFLVGIITFTGVGGVGASGGSMHGNQPGTSFTDTLVSTVANSVAVSALMFGQHSVTPDTFTGGNTRYDIPGSGQGGGAGDIALTTVTTYNLGWESTTSYNSVADLCQSLVELTPSGGAPTINTLPTLMLMGVGN